MLWFCIPATLCTCSVGEVSSETSTASAAAAGQPSSGQSGKRGAARNVHKPSRATSSSKHNQQQQQQQRIPQAAQYGLNHEATGLFTWADSAWFQRWIPPLLICAVLMLLFADLVISWHYSCLFGIMQKLGLLRRGDPAADGLTGRARRAAARGASSTDDNRQQQQPSRAGKQGKKKQASKAGCRQDINQSSNTRQAASTDCGSDCNTSKDICARALSRRHGSMASSDHGETEIQQQQRQNQGHPSSSQPAVVNSRVAVQIGDSAVIMQQAPALATTAAASTTGAQVTEMYVRDV